MFLGDRCLRGGAKVFPRPLRREIAILLAVKLLLLTALYMAFFTPGERLPAEVMQQHLLQD
jgi:hypothetical protein